jgi:hypothetical protein
MSIILEPHPIALTEDDVAQFESEFGFALPCDYRAFLLQYNGGVIRAPTEELTLGFLAEEHLPLSPADRQIAPKGFWNVALFHGLKRRPHDYGDVREIVAVMRDWDHPVELLPIASSLGNFKYFLCVDGPRRDQILVAGETWQGKWADDMTVTQDDYFCLCMSFAAMIDTLTFR